MLKELLKTFFTLHSTSHTPAKVVSKRKIINYDDKSRTLIYLLMLALFPVKAQMVTDLRNVKAAFLTCWSPSSLLSKAGGLSTMHMRKQPEKADGLSA